MKDIFIQELVDSLRNLADCVEKIMREESKEEEASIKNITLEDVREKLVFLSQKGKQKEVKELITNFGAEKLSDIPAEKYLEVLKKAEEIK